MVRDPNIIMEGLGEARKQSNELYDALTNLIDGITNDSSQRETFFKLMDELMEAIINVNFLEKEFAQATGNPKW